MQHIELGSLASHFSLASPSAHAGLRCRAWFEDPSSICNSIYITVHLDYMYLSFNCDFRFEKGDDHVRGRQSKTKWHICRPM